MWSHPHQVCSPLSAKEFSHPCDSKEPSHAQSNLKAGNPQASSSVNPSHTSLTKPPGVTQGSLLSPQGPWLLLSTFAFTEWKGRLQSLNRLRKMDQFSFPFRYRGWVPGGGGGGEASPGHLRRLSITWSTQRYSIHYKHTAQHSWEGLKTPTAASPRAVSRPTSAVGSVEWPCCLQSRGGAGWCELEGWMLQRHALRMLPKGRDCTLCSLMGNLCSLTRALWIHTLALCAGTCPWRQAPHGFFQHS